MAEMKTLTINGTPFTLPFAPDGYGLGEYGKLLTSDDDLNNITENGWYWWYESRPVGAMYNYCTMRVDSGGTSDYVTQTIIRASIGISYIRYCDGGTWYEEWVNPPMQLGVEYRTTERYKGKSVYAKLVEYSPSATIGNASGLTDVNIAHGIENFAALVRCDGTNGSQGCLPYMENNGASTSVVVVDSTNIKLRIINTTWSSGRLFSFALYYTKV